MGNFIDSLITLMFESMIAMIRQLGLTRAEEEQLCGLTRLRACRTSHRTHSSTLDAIASHLIISFLCQPKGQKVTSIKIFRPSNYFNDYPF